MSKTISLLILQAIFCFTLSYSQTTLETACQKTPNPPHCVSVLGRAPGSATANVSGLVNIAATSINYKATDMLEYIKTLIQSSGRDPSMKKALSDCLDSYNTILQSDIPEVPEAIAKGNPKIAVDIANDAANEAQKCANGFGQNLDSPILVPNKEVYDLCLILKSLASLLV